MKPKHRPTSSPKDRCCCCLLMRMLHLSCCSAVHTSWVSCADANKRLSSISCGSLSSGQALEKEQIKPSNFSQMHVCCTSCHMLSARQGCGVDVGLWWEGGSATALTDFQAPLQNRRKEPPPPPQPPPHLLTVAQALTKSIHEANTNHHRSTLRGFQEVVQDVWQKNPCLDHNQNTVGLQREAPAYATTTQNIADQLLNTDIEPRCNIKVCHGTGSAPAWRIKFCLLTFLHLSLSHDCELIFVHMMSLIN